GDVRNGLANAGKAKGFLRVLDGPRLVEAVNERAVGKGIVPLSDVATQAQVAIAYGEQGLRGAEVVLAEDLLHEPPRLHREAQSVYELRQARVSRFTDVVLHAATSSCKSLITKS